MKNIAIIVQKLNGGGAERVAANLSQMLHDKYNVHLIVFNGQSIKYPYSATLHDLNLPHTQGKFSKFVQFIKRIVAVYKIKKTNHISASISLMDGANLVNVFSKTGDKIITSIHSTLSKSRFKTMPQKIWNILLVRLVASRSDVVVAVSEGVRQDLIRNFGLKSANLITIYNACNTEHIHKSFEHCQNKNSMVLENSIITMGRLTEPKGQWHLIRAFSAVVEAVPNATLYILGEGPLREKLGKLVSDLNLTKHVIFLGFREPPYQYLVQSKVFVLSSLYEGHPMVLIEAMACGLPCISTDCMSGPREVLAPSTSGFGQLSRIEYGPYGVLTAVDSSFNVDDKSPLSFQEKQLGQAIISLLNDEKLRQHYKAQSFKRSQDFSPERIIGFWERIV